jgi:hypothetical protein
MWPPTLSFTMPLLPSADAVDATDATDAGAAVDVEALADGEVDAPTAPLLYLGERIGARN